MSLMLKLASISVERPVGGLKVRSEFATGRSPVQIPRHSLQGRMNFTENKFANIQMIN